MTLRVAVVAACPFPAPRGTPIRIHRIAEELARRGHDVHVVTYPLLEGEAADGLTVHRTRRIPGYADLAPGPTLTKLAVLDPLLALKLGSVLKRQRFDVIHAHHAEGVLAARPAASLRRVPLVYDVHTLLGEELPYYAPAVMRAPLRAAGRTLDAMLPRLADHVVAVSEEIRRALEPGMRAGRLSVVANGVEAAFFSDPQAQRYASSPEIVYAGNLAAYQGIAHLLEAFAIARAAVPELRLSILTDDDFSSYDGAVSALGVRSAVSVERCAPHLLPQRLAAARIAINPRSECAGVPQKLMNYMASGCAIVSFAGSAKHLRDGETAIIVPDADSKTMGAAIVRLVRDAEFVQRLGANARALAKDRYTWAQAVTRIEAAYEAAIRARAER
jgi:glycosyltransferase involved in cell wall biosynthesis